MNEITPGDLMEEVIVCPKCSKHARMRKMDDHLTLTHRVIPKFTCINCHESFRKASLFRKHLKNEHPDKVSLGPKLGRN
jgi:hypothetical protein